MDLIERHLAERRIDEALSKVFTNNSGSIGKQILDKIPSALPEPLVKESRTLVNDLVKDTISRQAALETVRTMHKRCDTDSVEDYRDLLVTCFKNLPSAQPEIVRCRECKHHWTHRCMDSMPTEVCELGQTFYDSNIDFCSLAERRTDD